MYTLEDIHAVDPEIAASSLQSLTDKTATLS